MTKGKLYLIPCTLGSETTETIPPQTRTVAIGIQHFVVERIRSARRYMRQLSKEIVIDDIQFLELDKRSDNRAIVSQAIDWLQNGDDVGILSEAGAPCIADPGHLVVKAAHQRHIEVVPLVGPSSMFLALMASGMNGQNFAFNGYLPIKKEELPKALSKMETTAAKMKQTQLFMETPYRNDQLWATALKILRPSTRLGYAADITLDQQDIKVKTIQEWQKADKPELHKRPTIFMISTT